MIDREHKLPVVRQCELLGLARSTAYYEQLHAGLCAGGGRP